MENFPVGAELFHADGRMDMTKIVVAFRSFANAPNNIPSSYIKAFNKKNYNLRRRHFLSKCRRIIWIIVSNVQQYRRSLKMTSRNQILLNLARQKPLLLQNLLVATKHPHNSLSSCCFSLLARIDVLRHLDADFTGSQAVSKC
jgi:hypothetical protein